MILKVCGVGAYEAKLERKVSLDLSKITKELERKYKIVVKTPYIVILNVNSIEVSVFTDGKLIIKRVESKNQAKGIAKSVYDYVGIEINDDKT